MLFQFTHVNSLETRLWLRTAAQISMIFNCCDLYYSYSLILINSHSVQSGLQKSFCKNPEIRSTKKIDLSYCIGIEDASTLCLINAPTWKRVGSVKRFFSARMRFGRSRSFKVIDFGTNRKRVCDFLLVCYSNLGHILHRFRDIAGFLCSWLDPTPISP